MYPSIGVDLLQGIKTCFAYHAASDITLHNFPIGFGLNDDELYKEAEKMLLVQDVDIVVAYADARIAKKLSPLFAAAGKLLIIVNAGAHYPVVDAGNSHILFNLLNNSLYAYMTGQLCSRLTAGKEAITATSYYDGGYQHCHAMTNAFMAAGGAIRFNFVSHFKKQDFTIQPLAAFLQSNPGVNTLLCLYSGDMARCFYEQVAPLQQQYQLRLFGSPMLFDSTPGDFAVTHPYVQHIQGYTGWVPALNNTQNNHFTALFKKEHNKAANLFTLQGWETALLILQYLHNRQQGAPVPTAIAQLQEQPVQSPRGTLRVNNHHVVTGPAYLVNATGELQIQVAATIEDTTAVFDEMVQQIPDTMFTSWRNTYLCI
jgi:ABC-type branched-subunit amino acid transport system substrate-binding protein